MTTLSRPTEPHLSHQRPSHPPLSAHALTVSSVAGLVLLLPTVVVAWVLVVSTERGTRCLMYGEQCSRIPGGALWACFWASAALGVLALVRPRTRWASARYAAVVLQWCTQLTLGALILAGA
ncbi:hypothetical protein [Streptomyces sp. AC512_CC834]|uniref:hypothetical protein n=1 Tax=Streptomyces sp. AC512_CC834 TaxID=2823691 RepID=UPI001C25BED2|nr:hypothetical protein [Streptomyces sp. AC512_CC834]